MLMKNQLALQLEINQLAQKLEINNWLRRDDWWYFTVNNTGTFGSVSSMGIINHPQGNFTSRINC